MRLTQFYYPFRYYYEVYMPIQRTFFHSKKKVKKQTKIVHYRRVFSHIRRIFIHFQLCFDVHLLYIPKVTFTKWLFLKINIKRFHLNFH